MELKLHTAISEVLLCGTEERHVERDKKTNSDRNGRTMSFQSKVIPLMFPSKNGGKETKKIGTICLLLPFVSPGTFPVILTRC